MSEVLSIEQLKKMALITIDIPDFENKGTIKVKVQKPRLMKMAAEGKIPNSLMSTAMEMAGLEVGKKESKIDFPQVAEMMELYCKACLVEPNYEEFKDIMTDEQMVAIFDWATEGLGEIDTFRGDKEDGTGNRDVEDIPEKTKRNNGDK